MTAGMARQRLAFSRATKEAVTVGPEAQAIIKVNIEIVDERGVAVRVAVAETPVAAARFGKLADNIGEVAGDLAEYGMMLLTAPAVWADGPEAPEFLNPSAGAGEQAPTGEGENGDGAAAAEPAPKRKGRKTKTA